jgi:hypothetical protein
MSKPSVRMIVSVLIGLVVVLAVFASVQAASSRASLSGERAFTTAGLLPDRNHPRAAFQSLQSFEQLADYPVMGEHDCYSDESSPDD